MTSSSGAAEAERSAWRWPAAAAALTVAAVHLPVTGEHLSEAPYVGWLFVALEVVAVALAVLLVARDTALVWTAAAVVPALAIGAYLLTRSVAMPQVAEDVGAWTTPLGIVALTAEALLLVIALGRRRGGGWSAPLRRHPVAAAVGLLVLGLSATVLAARSGTGTHAMGHAHAMGTMTSSLPPFGWSSFADHWHVRLPWLLFCVVALTAYLWAVSVARRHGVPTVSVARAGCFVAGIVVLLVTVSSAIDTYAMAIFWDHMIEHLLLIMVVPALLVLGGPIAAARAAASVRGREGRVDAVVLSWPVSLLTHPLVGFGLYAGVIIATHLTGFMDDMAQHAWLMHAEQWLYLVTGYVYLLPLIGNEPIRWQLPYLGRLGLLLLGMTPDAVVGIVLMQTTYDMFPLMEAGHPAWAPSPVHDLDIGGALMWVGGDGLMMLFGVGVTIAMITHTRSELVIGRGLEGVRRRTLAEHVARGGGATSLSVDVDVDDDDDVLDAYNAMLARMSGRTPKDP